MLLMLLFVLLLLTLLFLPLLLLRLSIWSAVEITRCTQASYLLPSVTRCTQASYLLPSVTRCTQASYLLPSVTRCAINWPSCRWVYGTSEERVSIYYNVDLSMDLFLVGLFYRPLRYVEIANMYGRGVWSLLHHG